MITPGLLAAHGVRIITRPFGHVVLTGVLQQNTEAFRLEVLTWLETTAGAAWLAAERLEGRA